MKAFKIIFGILALITISAALYVFFARPMTSERLNDTVQYGLLIEGLGFELLFVYASAIIRNEK